MFNKFKIGQFVYVYGTGKNNNDFYNNKKGKVIHKDEYFFDYLIEFSNGKTDWLDENKLTAIRKYMRKEQK